MLVLVEICQDLSRKFLQYFKMKTLGNHTVCAVKNVELMHAGGSTNIVCGEELIVV